MRLQECHMVLSTLTDLPNELLFSIFQELDDASIFQIGKLCRRLNEIAMPFILAREGLADPGACSILKPYHEDYQDSLSALTLNFSIHSIDSLFCILDDATADGYPATIPSLTRSVERISQLVARLTFIDTFHITFHKADSRWSLDSEDVREFMAAFLHLLETLTTKSCRSLQILHPHPIAFNSGYDFDSMLAFKTKRLRIADPLSSPSHGDEWQYRLDPELNPLYPIPFPSIQSSITTLDIISDFLFVPPFSKWTFHLMKISPITSLSISIHRFTRKDEFSLYILPRIINSVPKLQEIKLAFSCDDFTHILTKNLSRLPLLQKITTGLLVYPNMTSNSNPQRSIPFTLPHLTSFTGSPEQGVVLLEDMTCPQLHSVNLLIDISLRGKFDYSIAAHAFSNLARRFDTLKIRPRINVCLVTCGGRPFGNNPDEESPKPSWVRHFRSVSRLTLEMPRFFHDDNETSSQIDYALEWLSVFQGVVGLTLTTQRPARDDAARELRDMALRNAITKKFPKILHFNVTEVSVGAHYHWSNPIDELSRVGRVISDMTSPNELTSSSICCDF